MTSTGSRRWCPRGGQSQVRRIVDKIEYQADELAMNDEFMTGGRDVLLFAYGSTARGRNVRAGLRERALWRGFSLKTIWPFSTKRSGSSPRT